MKKPFLLGLLVTITSFLFAQRDTLAILKAAESLLEKKTKTISEILADSTFDFIHSKTIFRQLISKHAQSAFIKMTSPAEKAMKIEVTGKVIDQSGNPAKNAMVYVYQTDGRGWYGSDRPHFLLPEGDRRHARIFGYLVTDAGGNFGLETIQPKGYPESDLPAHIHFEVFDNNNRALIITELLFDDDERLKGDTRNRAVKEGFKISKPVNKDGKKTYNYIVQLN